MVNNFNFIYIKNLFSTENLSLIIMKILIPLFIVFIFPACNANMATVAEDKDSLLAGNKISAAHPLSEKHCYENYSEKDSVKLELITNDNKVTGTLQMRLFNKDENKGTFIGKMKGDTLIADYIFMSEGTRSVRQIAYLKRNKTLIEGYGNVEEKDGKMVFKNIAKLNFNDITPLEEVSCAK